MEFFSPILSKSFIMILHNFSIFLIILFRPLQSVSDKGHWIASITTFSEIDLDISPNPTIIFQISCVHWKALSDMNPTVSVLGESDGRISRNVNSKSMVEISKLPRRGAFYSRHSICIIYILYYFRRFPFKTYFINRFNMNLKRIY